LLVVTRACLIYVYDNFFGIIIIPQDMGVMGVYGKQHLKKKLKRIYFSVEVYFE